MNRLPKWALWTVPAVVGIALIVVVVLLFTKGTESGNRAPEIISVTSNSTSTAPDGACRISCAANDPDGDALIYTWSSGGGTISGEGSVVTWVAPDTEATYSVGVTIDDGRGGTDSKNINVVVSVTRNNPPAIAKLTTNPSSVDPGGSSTINCLVFDPDGDTLTYIWTCTGGTLSGTGDTVTWEAPVVGGTYTISVTVNDGNGGIDSDSVDIVIATIAEPTPSPILSPTVEPTGGPTSTPATVPTSTPTPTPTPTATTIVLYSISSEDGEVRSDGTVVTLPSMIGVGDWATNVGSRLFCSFDISSIPSSATVHDATLELAHIQVDGTPFASLLSLIVANDQYGTLDAGDYSGFPSGLLIDAVNSLPFTPLDATSAVENQVGLGQSRFQIQLYFFFETDGDSGQDVISTNPGLQRLTITYTP
jgi:hypothetical protein